MEVSLFKRSKALGSSALLILAVLLGHNADVLAATKSMKYLYRPDPGNPATNAFVPVGQVERCGQYVTCGANQRAVNIGSSLSSAIMAGSESRDTLMMRADTGWRQIKLFNGSTGDAAQVDVRVTGLSARIHFYQDVRAIVGIPSVTDNEAHDLLWAGRAWVYAPAPCRSWQSLHYFNNNSYVFGLFPSAETCWKKPNFDIENLSLSNMAVTYEVRLPRPQGLQSGIYTGSEVYSVGPNADIDFGDKILYADPVLELNIELEVDPIFKVNFPGGSNILSLAPEGGWMAWLQRGRKPTRLWRDQNFDLSSSVPFSMNLVCEHVQGDNCAIDNGKGHQVPVETRVTLPAGMRDSTGGPVRRYRLTHLDKPEFSPTEFITQRQATLHFEVPKDDMETMLDRAGSRYAGDVTIVWDSDI
jgi:hypothetical protein